MKKIGIDARLYSQTGVGTYIKNLIHYLDESKIKDERFYLYLMPEDLKKVDLKNKNIIKRKADYRWHTLFEQIGFLWAIMKDNLDLMHFTYFSYPVLYRRKFIATIHDATPLLFKTGRASTKSGVIYALKHFFFRIILKTQIVRAAKIITPTLAVKKELVGIYGEKVMNKAVAIHEGVNYQMLDLKSPAVVKNNFGKFFLYVGNFYPHKNVETLIRAFKKIETDVKLVLVGPDDFFTTRLEKYLGDNEKIVIVKNPPTEKLIFFYKNAFALVHPSLSEGFGLPILEAAYLGCPIIASDIPVFRELLGSDYLSFDPRSQSDLEEKIISFINKPVVFDNKNIKKKFSFRSMTDETLKIYREMTA